jgi:hypothetical protein
MQYLRITAIANHYLPFAAAFFCFAQRAFCASLMRFRAAALIVRRFLTPVPAAPTAPSVCTFRGRPDRRAGVPPRNWGKAEKIAARS